MHEKTPDGQHNVQETALSSSNQQVAFWRVAITTGGGFSGDGMGSVVTDSRGGVEIDLGKPDLPLCKAQLSTDALNKINKVIASTKPLDWKEQYVDPEPSHIWGDEVGYKLQLSLPDGRDAEKMYVSSWEDSSEHLLPNDLALLYREVMTIRGNAVNNCKD